MNRQPLKHWHEYSYRLIVRSLVMVEREGYSFGEVARIFRLPRHSTVMQWRKRYMVIDENTGRYLFDEEAMQRLWLKDQRRRGRNRLKSIRAVIGKFTKKERGNE